MSAIVDLVPFLYVTDVERSMAFYEVLGFEPVKSHREGGILVFAGLAATGGATVMLARASSVAPARPGGAGPGFLYLYTADLDAFRRRVTAGGYTCGPIEAGTAPGPRRQLCLHDPDGHGHMVAELWPGSVGRDRGA